MNVSTMLSELQREILAVVCQLEDPPVLFGGAALLVSTAQHRTTLDLDLAWSPADALGRRVDDTIGLLERCGYAVERLQTTPRFVRLRVAGADASLIVDLVAEPNERPRRVARVGSASILVPPREELLADKLCALLSRQEGRDLWDVQVLLASGASLEAGLRRAGELDTGFSPLTLAWVLRSWDLGAVARVAGWPESRRHALAEFRDDLLAALTSTD